MFSAAFESRFQIIAQLWQAMTLDNSTNAKAMFSSWQQ
jgi:hypothetical protein